MKTKRAFVASATALVTTAVLSGSAAAALPDLSTHDKWVWYQDSQYPMACIDGSATGLGYYVPSGWDKKHVLFWLDGGGICYDDQSCNKNSPPSAATLLKVSQNAQTPGTNVLSSSEAPFTVRTHYNSLDFIADSTDPLPGFQTLPDANLASWSKAALNRGVFDHTSTVNPFKNYLMVFVPYCTGDMHIGYRADTSSGIPGRTPANVTKNSAGGYNNNFVGLQDSYNSFQSILSSVYASAGASPQKVVLAGGSAGGFGANYLYGLMRAFLGPSSQGSHIVTISDAGMPVASGTSTDGVNWATQGYFNVPWASASTVGSMEEYMWDAWGSTWTAFVPATAWDSQPMIRQPLGDGRSFVPMQTLYVTNFANGFKSGSPNYGDHFVVFDSTNDYMYSTLMNLKPSTSSQIPRVIDAENQLVGIISLSYFFPLHNGTTTKGIPWNQHHGSLTDDVSTWDTTGSDDTWMLSRLSSQGLF